MHILRNQHDNILYKTQKIRYHAVTASEHGDSIPGCLASLGKGKNRINKHFFELPKPLKRAIWAALLAEWQKKKAANRANG